MLCQFQVYSKVNQLWWWSSRYVVPDSFETPWRVAQQAPVSMGLPRQEHWSGLPFPPPGDLPDPGTKLVSPGLQADSLPLSYQGNTHTYIHSFSRFSSYIGFYRVLSRVPCAIQQVLIICLSYIQQYVYINPNFPICISPHPLVTISLFSTSVTLLLFCK